MSANLFELVRGACTELDKILVESDRRRFTCRDTLLLTGRLANILVLSGVEPDDRVVVQAEPSPEHVMLFLAVLRAGAVYLSVDKVNALGKLDDLFAEAAPKLVVCPPSMREQLAPLAEKHAVSAVQTIDARGGGMLIDAAGKAPSEFADVPREEKDLATIFYVVEDGRAVRHTHGELSARAKALIDAGRFMQLLALAQN
jgi:malonyl-CoA/methylmalonyl-CoA synthetase